MPEVLSYHEPVAVEAEKPQELEIMKDRIEAALNNPEIRSKVESDFAYTFSKLGLASEEASRLKNTVIEKLLSDDALEVTEKEVLGIFEKIAVKADDGPELLIEVLHQKLAGRAELIHQQIENYFQDINGKVVDYGAGDGQVTQKLHDDGLDIEGYDVRSYPAEDVTVPIKEFDGGHVPAQDGYYQAALMTNVAHHEKDNEKIIQELTRIVSDKLVVIETVPTGETAEEVEQDRERTFMNDYLYNRLFHNADIPVPGTYETPQGWVNRFARYGWRVTHSQDLGFDQPTIRDVHHLLVFEK